MTIDPYTNRIPNGLLTADEKAALLATGGPWEYWDDIRRKWDRCLVEPTFHVRDIYRAARKPLPVPQEGDVWVATNGKWYAAEPAPADAAGALRAAGWRLFREVKA
jgi:hypothetical protein